MTYRCELEFFKEGIMRQQAIVQYNWFQRRNIVRSLERKWWFFFFIIGALLFNAELDWMREYRYLRLIFIKKKKRADVLAGSNFTNFLAIQKIWNGLRGCVLFLSRKWRICSKQSFQITCIFINEILYIHKRLIGIMFHIKEYIFDASQFNDNGIHSRYSLQLFKTTWNIRFR